MTQRCFALLAIFLLLGVIAPTADAQDEKESTPPAADAQAAVADAPADDDEAEADAPADKATAAKKADPSGSWKWERTFNENTMEFLLKLDWNGKKLTGTYTSFGISSDIEKAELKGDDLSFVVHREFNGNEFDVNFKGKVVEDELRGTITANFGGEPREFEWLAKRHVGVEDVLGTWQLRLETPNGIVEPQITITETDDGLHGAYVSLFGELEAKNVELKDNQLMWEVSGENQGFTFKVNYSGEPRGNTIEGTNKFDFNGNTGEVEFTGKRTPPKKLDKTV